MDELDGDGTAGGRASGRAGWPIDPHRLTRALWGGRRLLIGAGVVGLVVGYLAAKLLLTSGYQTTAILRYEGELDLPGSPPTRDAIGPAADALKQQSVLRQIREETGFKGPLSRVAASIGSQIDYITDTMQITVGGATGEEAAARARLVTDVFLRYHKERQSRRIEDEIARMKKRIEAAEGQAEEARRTYNAFREEHGIADLSTEQHSMVQSAAKLQADSELAASEVRALEAEVQSLEAQLANIPKTSFVAGSSPERAAYDRLRQELVNARATLSEDHPRVQALQQQVDQLRSQLRRSPGASAAGDGTVSLNSTYQLVDEQLRGAKARLTALRERQKGLSEMAKRAQGRVEAFSEVEGEATGLLASVTVNDNLVSSLRRTEAALEDALRDPPSGFVVLDPGAVPEYPVRNKMKLVVFAVIPMLTLGLALLIVLRREFRGLRVQTPAEVAFWGNGPVLGATPWPEDPRGLDELVAGLDDFAPDAIGTLLIVGSSADDSGRAAELAERINEDWFFAGNTGTPRQAPRPASHGPLRTPPPAPSAAHSVPPSGPYPIGSQGTRSTALARLPSVPSPEPDRLAHRPRRLRLEAWEGPDDGQALRRAARLADRVIVLVRSGAVSAFHLHAIANRLGRAKGVGYVLIGLPEELRALPDRVGNVAAFWKS
ncbi:MAG: hypothetical protein WAU39_00345 [Polyangiales bacterium]